MVMRDIVDIIGICFIFSKGSLSRQMMCFRKALSLVAQVKISRLSAWLQTVFLKVKAN